MDRRRRAVAGSKPDPGSSTPLICPSASPIGRASDSALAVGCMPEADRTNRSSPNSARKRVKTLLIDGCARPTRWPARVTLRSSISASKATRRLRSTEAKFILAMVSIVKIDFKNDAEGGLLGRKTRLDEAYAILTPAPHPARTDIAGTGRVPRIGLSGARGSGSPPDADHDLPDRARNA